MRGLLTGMLALIALQAVVTKGSGRVAEAFTGLAAIVNHVVSPNVPAIPDLRTRSTTAGGDWPAASPPAAHLTSTRPAAPVALNA